MKHFLLKIYSFALFSDLVFIYPLYTIMFADNGMSPLQISLLLTIWVLTAFILEVPSGVIADQYPRKYILFFAELTRIIGYLFWIFKPNFIGYMIGFILWGIKGAFTSGTIEALVYDELKANKQEGKYLKVSGRMQSLHYFAFIFAGIGASLGIKYGYNFVIYLSLISLIIAAASIISLPKVAIVDSTGEKDYFKLLKAGIHSSFKVPSILKIIIFASLANALFGSLDEYWSIFASLVGLSKGSISIFFVFYGLVQALASLIAYKFEKISSQFFAVLFLLNGLLLLVSVYLQNIPALLLVLLFNFSFEIVYSVSSSQLQHAITSDKVRSTITSVKGFIVNFLIIAIILFFGYISQIFDYKIGFYAMGGVTTLIGLIYVIFSNKLNYVAHK